MPWKTGSSGRFAAFVVVLALAFPSAARADAGIAMLPVAYPNVLWFLLLVIVVELLCLESVLGVRWRETALAVAGTNIIGMAVGYPLAWALYRGLSLALGFPQRQADLLTSRQWGPAWVCAALYENWRGVQEQIIPILCVFIALMVPSYLVSKLIKLRLIRWYEAPSIKFDLRPAVIVSNRISFAVLVVAGCILLYRFYSRY